MRLASTPRTRDYAVRGKHLFGHKLNKHFFFWHMHMANSTVGNGLVTKSPRETLELYTIQLSGLTVVGMTLT